MIRVQLICDSVRDCKLLSLHDLSPLSLRHVFINTGADVKSLATTQYDCKL